MRGGREPRSALASGERSPPSASGRGRRPGMRRAAGTRPGGGSVPASRGRAERGRGGGGVADPRARGTPPPPSPPLLGPGHLPAARAVPAVRALRCCGVLYRGGVSGSSLHGVVQGGSFGSLAPGQRGAGKRLLRGHTERFPSGMATQCCVGMGTGYQAPCTEQEAPCTEQEAPCTRYHALGTGYHAPCARYHALSTQYHALGTVH